MTPPRKPARGREHDRLVVYLVLTGNATLSTAEYLQLTSQTASSFFETSGALTTAMRTSVETLNRALLDRNMDSTGQGQYAVGSLVLAVMRNAQCTLLQSGPMHIYALGSEAIQHLHDPALLGKGLGLSQAATIHFSQFELKPGDRLIFSAKPPDRWERAIGNEMRPSTIEVTRQRLLSAAQGDVNAILIQADDGGGDLRLLRPALPSKGTPKAVAPAPPPATESLPPTQAPDAIPDLDPAGYPEESSNSHLRPTRYPRSRKKRNCLRSRK